MIVDNFLPHDQYQVLQHLAKTLYENAHFKRAGIGHDGFKQVNNSIRSDEIFWLDSHSNFPAVNNYLHQLEQLMQLFNQTLFLSLVEFESHIAIYPPGSFYRKHRDQFHDTRERKLSCVYYLNEDWQIEDGGALILYNEDSHMKASIRPNGNRFVCFLSHLEHEVLPTNKERISITSWLKTRNSIPLPV